MRGNPGATIFPSLASIDDPQNPNQSDPDAEPDIIVGDDGLARPRWAIRNDYLKRYYDAEWGSVKTGERELFELLSLEVFQTGLSWGSVLARRDALRSAFFGFDPSAVAQMTEEDVNRLVNDDRIIRNRAKIRAIIGNARATVALREDAGAGERPDAGAPSSPDAARNLPALIWDHRPQTTPAPQTQAEVAASSEESAALALALKRHGFSFVGPRTCHALMQAAGVIDNNLVGTHRRGASGIWNEDGSRAREVEI